MYYPNVSLFEEIAVFMLMIKKNFPFKIIKVNIFFFYLNFYEKVSFLQFLNILKSFH